jgi:broad specificity phosphatase PhoE
LKRINEGVCCTTVPRKKTFETANIICEKNNAKSHSDEGLLFRGQGIVAGLTYDEVGIRYPEYYSAPLQVVNFLNVCYN